LAGQSRPGGTIAAASGGTSSLAGTGAKAGSVGTGGSSKFTTAGGATTDSKSGSSQAGSSTVKGGASASGGESATGGNTRTGGSTGATSTGSSGGGASVDAGAAGSTGTARPDASAGGKVACSAPAACIDFTNLSQEIDGFGASSAGHGLLGTAELDAAFKNETNKQLGLSILRVEIRVMGESDWVNEKANASNAKARGAKFVLASPWSPPVSMKTNKNEVAGELSTSSYADYAAYLKSFKTYMGSAVDIISVQNEPNIKVEYVSCSWNPTQIFNFVKNNAQDVGVPLMIPETSYPDTGYSDPVLNDATAASHISYIGMHLYGGQIKPYTLAIQKQKRVWMTEHLFDPEDIGTTMNMAKEIMECMNAQMNGYVWWYLRTPNCNLVTSSGGITNKGYVMGQFSKYVRPGSFRVNTTYQIQNNVNVQAYAGEKNVIIALNRGTSSVTQTFTVVSGSFANVKRTTTSNSKKLADDGAVTLTNSSFTSTLDPQSITTFVGE
jgi:glucuronoarabinoxylan endo-1,4-beta-xylanase